MGKGVGGTGTRSMLGRKFVIGVGDDVVVGYTESEFVESVGGRVCIVGVMLGMIDIINDSKQYIRKVVMQ